VFFNALIEGVTHNRSPILSRRIINIFEGVICVEIKAYS